MPVPARPRLVLLGKAVSVSLASGWPESSTLTLPALPALPMEESRLMLGISLSDSPKRDQLISAGSLAGSWGQQGSAWVFL